MSLPGYSPERTVHFGPEPYAGHTGGGFAVGRLIGPAAKGKLERLVGFYPDRELADAAAERKAKGGSPSLIITPTLIV